MCVPVWTSSASLLFSGANQRQDKEGCLIHNGNPLPAPSTVRILTYNFITLFSPIDHMAGISHEGVSSTYGNKILLVSLVRRITLWVSL